MDESIAPSPLDTVSSAPSGGKELASDKQPLPKVSLGWLTSTLLAIGLVVIGGVVHGRLTNRWGTPIHIDKIAQTLRTIPVEIGPWKSEGDQELPESTLTLLECKGYINRTYVHQATGEVVNVAVTFGPKGPIAVHTPEVCYSSREVNPTGKRKAVGIDFDGTESTIWQLRFTTNSIEKSKLSVSYAWSDGGPWQAAESPRFWRTDYLYKLQTASPMMGNNEDATAEFFKLFLPELRKSMTLKSNSPT